MIRCAREVRACLAKYRRIADAVVLAARDALSVLAASTDCRITLASVRSKVAAAARASLIIAKTAISACSSLVISEVAITARSPLVIEEPTIAERSPLIVDAVALDGALTVVARYTPLLSDAVA